MLLDPFLEGAKKLLVFLLVLLLGHVLEVSAVRRPFGVEACRAEEGSPATQPITISIGKKGHRAQGFKLKLKWPTRTRTLQGVVCSLTWAAQTPKQDGTTHEKMDPPA